MDASGADADGTLFFHFYLNDIAEGHHFGVERSFIRVFADLLEQGKFRFFGRVFTAAELKAFGAGVADAPLFARDAVYVCFASHAIHFHKCFSMEFASHHLN